MARPPISMAASRVLPRLLAIGLLGLACLAQAQAQNAGEARASREREMLRRAQSALKEAQGARDTLTAEKTALAAERDKLGTELAALRQQGQARQRSQQAELQRLQADVERQAAELEALKRSSSQAAEEATRRDAEQRERIATLQRELAERTQANRTLAQLLERSSAEARAADARAAQLHALGLGLIERWRGRTQDDLAAIKEPVFGLAAVAMEGSAESLRQQLDALRPPVR